MINITHLVHDGFEDKLFGFAKITQGSQNLVEFSVGEGEVSDGIKHSDAQRTMAGYTSTLPLIE